MAETHSKSASHLATEEDFGSETNEKCRLSPKFSNLSLPPKDFIPLKASEETRLSFGFPPRPNPATHPEQHQLWERTLAVPMKIQAHVPGKPLELDIPGKTGATTIKPLLQPLPQGPGTTFWGTAASVYQSLPGCNNVNGSWIVPRIDVPVDAQGYGPWAVSCVVQLDSKLLGGTTSTIAYADAERTQTITHAFAWTTFLSNQIEFSNYNILNIAVNQGDSVTCAVCAPFSTTYGTCLFTNQTQQQSTSLLVTQPTRVDVLTGSSAAWGVVVGSEVEGLVFYDQPPTFFITAFSDCSCSSKTTSLGLEPGEAVSNLAAPAGSTGPNPIWTTVVLNSSAFWVINNTP